MLAEWNTYKSSRLVKRMKMVKKATTIPATSTNKVGSTRKELGTIIEEDCHQEPNKFSSGKSPN